MQELGAYRTGAAAIALAVLWLLEGLLPQFQGRHHRLRHGLHNLALGLLNAAVVALGFAWAITWVSEMAAARGFGLAYQLAWPVWLQWLLVLVLFDLWQYLWHFLNHHARFLMRFHAVHHADAELDVTSALRFHTGEIVLSSVSRLAIVPLLGMSIPQLLLYESILLPVILFHHSNVRVPARLDRALRMLIATPWMHWVHHSRIRAERDSNYSSVLSIWDRLFRTFRLRDRPETIELGLDAFATPEAATLRGMLLQPFQQSWR